jgi:hypothetical protein
MAIEEIKLNKVKYRKWSKETVDTDTRGPLMREKKKWRRLYHNDDNMAIFNF